MSFTISGRSSELSIDFHPPLELDTNLDYVIGLVSFETYMTIPNIDSSNDTIHYTDVDSGQRKSIVLPTGLYEIDDINKYIRRKLGVEYAENEEYYNKVIEKKKKERAATGTVHSLQVEEEKEKKEKSSVFFNITPDTNTLKCNIISSYEIDFTPENSIGKLLGFNKRKKLSANEIHESDETVEIFRVNIIRIDCNVVTGTYDNDKPSHTLHEFFPAVEPGYKIIESPSNVIYLPVNTQTINNLTVRIVDQNQNLINFRREQINLRLHLKPLVS